MGSVTCSYEGCFLQKVTHGSIAFFRLPKDERRNAWIENSGNKALKDIGINANRFFCENHFHSSDIRAQFNRKLLRTNAIPIAFNSCQNTVQKHSVPKILNPPQQEKGATKHFRDDDIILKLIHQKPENSLKTSGIKQSEENLIDLNNHALENVINFDEIVLDDDDDNDGDNNDDENDDNCNIDDGDNGDDGDYRSSINPEWQIVEERDVSVELTEEKENDDRKVTSTKATVPRAPIQDNDYEDDKHYALSLVGYFQRLPHRKKAVAKIKILQYLYELEFKDNN